MKPIGLVILLGFSGCISIHHLTPRPLVEPALPQAFEGADGHAERREDWWVVYGDETLDRLVRRGLARNLTLQAMAAQVEQLGALAAVAGAARFPSLRAQINGSGVPVRPINLGIALPGMPTETQTQVQLQAQLDVSYEADLFARVRHGAAAARLDADALRRDRQALELGMVGQIVNLYHVAVEGRALQQLLEQHLKVQQEQLSNLHRRHGANMASLLDLRQHEQLIATTKARLPLIQHQVRRADQGLALVLGQPSGASLTGSLAQLPDPGKLPAAGVPGALLLARPDVAAAYDRLRAADHRVGAALARRWPTLRLGGSAGVGAVGKGEDNKAWRDALSDDLGVMTDELGDHSAWTVNGGFAVPLFQGGAIVGGVRAARAGLRAAVARYQQTALTAVDEVQGAFGAVRAQRLYLDRLAEQRVAVGASHAAAQRRYRAGLIDYQVVLQTGLGVLAVDQALLAARRRLLSLHLTAVRSLGTPLPVGGSGPLKRSNDER
jgi:NodT family efflux transporter outer membrane factor (OMF) lipoprotein